jgi:hypothetical protein
LKVTSRPIIVGGFKRILLLACQILLLGFAGYITIQYLLAVEPVLTKWMGALSLSNPFKIILGPAIAFFFFISSHALGRFLWTRLGGQIDFPGPGAEFTLLAGIGVSFQAVLGWVLFALGWLPGALFFFIGLVAFVIELNPTLENFRSLFSPAIAEGESFSRKTLTWLTWLMLIFFSFTPFTWGIPDAPTYLTNPVGSFKLTLGHSPLGLEFPLHAIYARIAGPWAANAVSLGLMWLIVIMMIDVAQRLFTSRPAGLLGVILLICVPFQFSLVTIPSREIVLAFFLIMAYSALVWSLFDDRFEGSLLSGFFLGLALSVSTRGIIFAAIYLLYAIIGSIGKIRARPLAGTGSLVAFIILTTFGASLLSIQNRYLAGNSLYPLFAYSDVSLSVPEPHPPEGRGEKPSEAKPIPPDALEGVDFPTHYGNFAGVGYKMTMSTNGDLSAGPQGLGPFFMAFIPGILLIMITRRHTLEAWTLILLLLFVYLYWAYIGRIVSLKMLYAIFPFQALLTGYIVDRLYLLSKLEEKRPMSYIFIILFIPGALLTFLWTCPGYGL